MSQAPGQKVGSYDNEKPHLSSCSDGDLHLESAVAKRWKPGRFSPHLRGHGYGEGCSQVRRAGAQTKNHQHGS